MIQRGKASASGRQRPVSQHGTLQRVQVPSKMAVVFPWHGARRADVGGREGCGVGRGREAQWVSGGSRGRQRAGGWEALPSRDNAGGGGLVAGVRGLGRGRGRIRGWE